MSAVDWLFCALLLVVVTVSDGLVALCFVIGYCHCQWWTDCALLLVIVTVSGVVMLCYWLLSLSVMEWLCFVIGYCHCQ